MGEIGVRDFPTIPIEFPMNVPEPFLPSLADALAFNERLRSLSEAGIPLLLEYQAGEASLAIDRINARLAIRSGSGESLPAILDSDSLFSPQYRKALEDWVQSDRSMAAAQPLVSAGQRCERLVSNFNFSMGSVAILWLFASLCLLLLVWRLPPEIGRLYEVSQRQPGIAYKVLDFLHQNLAWLSVLAFLIPLIVLFLWRWFAQSEPLHSWALRSGTPPDRSDDVATPCNSNLWKSLASIASAQAERRLRTKQRWLPFVLGLLAGGLIVLGLGTILIWPMAELLNEIANPIRRIR